ncbi:MAG: membrane protein insertion efficiency factor YidD [Candidatus Levyibacteriota bacterium]|jgi:putative membrane protein insertion efficiency factor
MKKIIISIIGFYQVVLSNLLLQLTGTQNACRFSPTCSEYAKISISEKGLFKGGYLSIVRLLKCQPFYNGN